ncbi:unnamed protein product [Linum trigynum]|uniref:Uncharacterized protein n=1 Tax=Linum trigynum TaxID=586398 RepID=A0AAV2GMC2_9ROSI
MTSMAMKPSASSYQTSQSCKQRIQFKTLIYRKEWNSRLLNGFERYRECSQKCKSKDNLSSFESRIFLHL